MSNLLRLLPLQASAHAADVDRIITNVHWLIVALGVGWGLFFLYCLLRFNRRANPHARYRNLPGRLAWIIVGAVAVIELWELFFVAIPLWAARVGRLPADRDATVVRVVAEQFAWNAHYPGPDGIFGRTDARFMAPENALGIDMTDPAARDDVATVNQLVFPIGRPVVVELTSKDVIHSFSLPQMRIKQDAVPGMMVRVWFVPTVLTPPGTNWEINCSQLCGLAHYRMRGFYRAVSPAEFLAFIAAKGA